MKTIFYIKYMPSKINNNNILSQSEGRKIVSKYRESLSTIRFVSSQITLLCIYIHSKYKYKIESRASSQTSMQKGSRNEKTICIVTDYSFRIFIFPKFGNSNFHLSEYFVFRIFARPNFQPSEFYGSEFFPVRIFLLRTFCYPNFSVSEF